MKIFEVEQYWIYTGTHHVQANTEAEAIAMVLNGVSNGFIALTRVEAAASYGDITRDDNPQLFRELSKLKVIKGSDEFIPSIGNIKEITGNINHVSR